MSHTVETVLVIGAEKLSSIINWNDRNTCVLFGDGAGAAVLRNRPGSHGLLSTYMGSDGNKAELLCMPGGGSKCPPSTDSLASGMHYLRMDGKETFKNAVNAMFTAAAKALDRAGTDISQIKCVIPHQANRRIIDAVAERLGAAPGQVFTNLEKYGNTSAASVAIALDEAVQTGRIEKGDLILLIAFGAGLTWAAAVIEW
jgi:3-oxoacyl-[acyl-carrier-protein] synthase-3